MTDFAIRKNVEALLRRRAEGARDDHPLSHGQQAMWLLHQLDPSGSAYSIAFAAHITGVDTAAFGEAVRALVTRHAALRTTFGVTEDEVFQTVHGWLEPVIEEVDATGVDDAGRAALVRARYEVPFDSRTGPLVRAHLIRTDPHAHIVLLVVHHLVCDFWSLGVMLDELAVLYRAEIDRVPAGLGTCTPYRAFVSHQRAYLDSAAGRRAREYWHTRLSGDLPVLEWPAFRPDPDQAPAAGGSLHFQLDAELAKRVTAFAREQRRTPYQVLLTAFQILLSRYTACDDVLVGSPMSGRTRPEFDDCVGYFTDPVVLRADLSGQPTTRELISENRRTVADALEYQDYPFDVLVSELAPRRRPGVNPIFQTMFVYQKPQRFPEWARLYWGARPADELEQPLRWAGLDVRPFRLAQQEGQLDLILEAIEAGDALLGVLKYRPAVFSSTAARAMVRHLITLLSGMIDEPDQPVSTLGLLDEPPRRRPVAPAPESSDSLPARFAASVAAHADRPAVRFGGSVLTYRELDHRARRLGAALTAEGVTVGDRVALVLEPSLELVIAILAVQRAGAGYVAIDHRHPPARRDMMLGDCGAAVVLCHQRHASSLVDGPAPRLLAVDDPAPSHEHPGSERPVGAADLAYTVYTSGSTGAPKGIDVTHGNVLSLVDAMLTHPDLVGEAGPDAVWSMTHSISFDLSVWEMWGALLTGATLVVVPSEVTGAPNLLRELLVRERVTHLNQTPSGLHGLAAEIATSGAGGLVLRHVFSCGELLPAETARATLGWCGRLWNLYGPAETTICVTAWVVRERDCRTGGVTVGRELANSTVYVLDRHHQPLPEEVTGEVYIGGLGVAPGYHERPELTARRFLDDPFGAEGDRLYRTGDLGRINADGLLEILGRTDNQVKVSGYRIELEEIEATLNADPAVDRSVVLVEGDGLDDRRLTACVVPAVGRGLVEADLRRALAERLPPYMIPGSVLTFESLPSNTNQKVDRGALAERVRARRATEAAHSPEPAAMSTLGGTERLVADVWRRVLRREHIPATANFFEVGGNSMLLLQVHRALRGTPAGAELTVAEMFRHPTVAGLARRMRPDPGPATAPGVLATSDAQSTVDAGRGRAAVRRTLRDAVVERRSGRSRPSDGTPEPGSDRA